MPYLLVSLGAIIGANSRFIVGAWFSQQYSTRFPLGTFFINITGSFILGLVVTLAAERLIAHPEHMILLLGVGFCGAYTTFSTFEFENQALLSNGELMFAVMNFVLSPLVGYLALRLGMLLAYLCRR
jgi:CrcB protein